MQRKSVGARYALLFLSILLGLGIFSACDNAENPIPTEDRVEVFVSPDGDDRDGGLSSDSPVKTLSVALIVAKNNDASAIKIQEGSYSISETLVIDYPVDITGSYNSNWEISDDAPTTVIEGAQILMKVDGTGLQSTEISGITFAPAAPDAVEDDPYYNQATFNQRVSCAVYVDAGEAEIENCSVVYDESAEYDIINGFTAYNGTMTISNSSVRTSSAVNGNYGIVAAGEFTKVYVTSTDIILGESTAWDTVGGLVDYSAKATFVECDIKAGKGSRNAHGVIALHGAVLDVSRCTIDAGEALDDRAVAVHLNGSGDVEVNNSTLIGGTVHNEDTEWNTSNGFEVFDTTAEVRLLNNTVRITDTHEDNGEQKVDVYGCEVRRASNVFLANNLFVLYNNVWNNFGISLRESSFAKIVHNTVVSQSPEVSYTPCLEIEQGSGADVVNNLFYGYNKIDTTLGVLDVSSSDGSLFFLNPDEEVLLRNNMYLNSGYTAEELKALTDDPAAVPALLTIEAEMPLSSFSGSDVFVDFDTDLSDGDSGDWHLKAGSVAIDRGIKADTPKFGYIGDDLEGVDRAEYGRPDLGAYEYEKEALDFAEAPFSGSYQNSFDLVSGAWEYENGPFALLYSNNGSVFEWGVRWDTNADGDPTRVLTPVKYNENSDMYLAAPVGTEFTMSFDFKLNSKSELNNWFSFDLVRDSDEKNDWIRLGDAETDNFTFGQREGSDYAPTSTSGGPPGIDSWHSLNVTAADDGAGGQDITFTWDDSTGSEVGSMTYNFDTAHSYAGFKFEGNPENGKWFLDNISLSD